MKTLVFFICCLCVVWAATNNITKQISKNTALRKQKSDALLLLATLDGQLVAIEQETGNIRWKIKDKPIVKVPCNTQDAITPVLLPDPRDGSLYLLGGLKEPPKKLPFTIPELVATSPCRSSDGVLYTGKKKDTWFSLDPKTGERNQVAGWENFSPKCPVKSEKAIYVGRTKYSIMMVDTKPPQRKWNITFYDYRASPMTKDELNNYELVHFTSSSNGRVVTLDKIRGSVLWDHDLASPIIGAYTVDKEGLLTVPFTSMANHTLAHLVSHFSAHQQPFISAPSHMKLYPTLYVGEHVHGLYALPSLVDQNVVTITSSRAGPLLLEGPGDPDLPKPYRDFPVPGHNYELPPGLYKMDPVVFRSMPDFKDKFVIFLGHYNVPAYASMQYFIGGRTETKLLTDASSEEEENKGKSSVGVQTEPVEETQIVINETTLSDSIKDVYNDLKQFINMQENKGLKLTLIVLVGCIIAMFWYLQMQVRGFQHLSQGGSRTSQPGSMGKYGLITAIAEELPDGLMRVGKITFHPDHLLGKGCEGTFVYKGEFDNRKVAVKRLLPECFNFADREVALLRESDAHPNVVRYYCMEQDRMFRYIALELCQATLSDYIQGKCDTSTIQPMEILQQATSGLAHLHSLDIVHRDIKPHNVLLSVPDNQGKVRAMISDFGLCKKLQLGRVSFSRRSGVTGTDGWIAPEMLDGNERTTCAVDLFSLGCLFYYVLSEGDHPFGDSLRRQANILCGESSLDDLKGAQWQITLQKPLIASLISSKPPERPLCLAVLSHPIFWDSKRILGFFQDVSDRIEKAEENDPVLCVLEKNGQVVVRGDWRWFIHHEVANDLRKYRSYKGESVRDLLRAFRNKKHHFRELTPEAQEALGESPEAYTNYWLTRFPLLLVHTWLAMQCVAHEITFSQYYPTKFRYPDLDYTKYEVEPPPDTLEVDAQERAEFMSPKKFVKKHHKVSFYLQRRYRGKKRDVVEDVGVGLNRNLGAVEGAAKEEGVKNRGPRQRVKKPVEEPLVWRVAEN